MSTPVDTSVWPPIAELRQRLLSQSKTSLAKELGASRTTLDRYLNGRTAIADANDVSAIVAADKSFIAIMQQAIASGQESVSYGIKQITEPLLVKPFSKPAAISEYSSPAAWCAG